MRLLYWERRYRLRLRRWSGGSRAPGVPGRMPRRLWSCEPDPGGSRRVSSLGLLPQLNNFEFGQHADGACPGLVFRHNQAESALRAEQWFAVGGVRQQNLIVDKGRVQFGQRKQHLISILRFGEHVTG